MLLRFESSLTSLVDIFIFCLLILDCESDSECPGEEACRNSGSSALCGRTFLVFHYFVFPNLLCLFFVGDGFLCNQTAVWRGTVVRSYREALGETSLPATKINECNYEIYSPPQFVFASIVSFPAEQCFCRQTGGGCWPIVVPPYSVRRRVHNPHRGLVNPPNVRVLPRIKLTLCLLSVSWFDAFSSLIYWRL